MANRPVFIPNLSGTSLTDKVVCEFEWFPGFAVTQKQKSIRALHEAAAEEGISPVLEISSKSEDGLGQQLSAFNLTVDMDDGVIPLESAFQGSKVFVNGGPYPELYKAAPIEAKRDSRLRDSGPLQCFEWQSTIWQLEPKTAFYDWLYLHAVSRDMIEELVKYEGFTDIEFNPNKSWNCQANSAALLVALEKRGELEKALRNQKSFLEVLDVGRASGEQRAFF